MRADDGNDAVLFEKIKKGNYDADDPIWENISADAKVRYGRYGRTGSTCV